MSRDTLARIERRVGVKDGGSVGSLGVHVVVGRKAKVPQALTALQAEDAVPA